MYPTYCTGWIYITTPGTAAAIVEAATRLKFFWIDDAWVTGYIAEDLKITHLDMMKYCTMMHHEQEPAALQVNTEPHHLP